MRFFSYIFLVALCLGGVFLFVGFLTPREYRAEAEEVFAVPRSQVWDEIANFTDLPSRRTDIRSVEIIGVNEEGHLLWRQENNSGGHTIFEVFEQVPPQKLVLRMGQSSYGMTGNWTYILSEDGQGTRVVIAEESELKSIWGRSIMTLIGRKTNLKAEMRSLEKALLAAD